MRTILLAILLNLILGPVWAQSTEDQAIIELIRTETEAYDAHDFDAWAACWMHHEKAMTLVPSANYEIFSWQAMVDSAQKYHFVANARPDNRRLVNRDHRVSVMGNLAFATYIQERQDKKGRIQESNREFRVLLKQDGQWRIMVVYATPQWQATDAQANHSLQRACRALGESGQHERALTLLQTGESLYPKDPWYINGQAFMYMKMGDKVQAKAHFERSLKVSKTSFAQEMLAELGN